MKIARSTVVACALLLPMACAKIDKASVRASSEIPVSAQVDEIRIARDQEKPIFAIHVQEVWDQGPIRHWYSHSQTDVQGQAKVAKDTEIKAGANVHHDRTITDYTISAADRTRQITAQLTSALSNVGNFKLVSKSGIKQTRDGKYTLASDSWDNNLRGPFILRARITEYQTVSDYTEEALRLGVYKDKTKEARGVVAFDLELIEGATGEIVTAFPSRASFGYKDRTEGSGIIPIYKQRQYAQSALDQALRQATNSAAAELWSRLQDRAL